MVYYTVSDLVESCILTVDVPHPLRLAALQPEQCSFRIKVWYGFFLLRGEYNLQQYYEVKTVS